MPDLIAPFPAGDHVQGRTDNLAHCDPKNAQALTMLYRG